MNGAALVGGCGVQGGGCKKCLPRKQSVVSDPKPQETEICISEDGSMNRRRKEAVPMRPPKHPDTVSEISR
jgi:hypothetical protein